MRQRKLLIATFYFPPCAGSGVFRMLGFARHLPNFNWQTIVVAPPKMPWEPEDEELSARIPPETVVRHVPYSQGRLWRTLKLAATYERWLPRALPACARIAARERLDAVLTSGPPQAVHMLGLWLKRRHGLPWVVDLRDPWITGGWPRRGLRRRWEPHLERMMMRHADVVIANAPRACANLQDAYPERGNTIISIANGFDPDDFSAAKESLGSNGSIGPPAVLRIVHTGDMYFRRDPRSLLDAVQALGSNDDDRRTRLKLCFIGQTHELADEVRRRGMDSLVEIRAHVEYRQAQVEMTQADVLLLLDAPGRRSGVPAKLYEYLGAARPILALAEPDGDTAWVLRESGAAHRLARPDDTAGIQKALTELIEASNSPRAAPASADALAQFTREHMARRLAETLDRVVGSPSATAEAPARAAIELHQTERHAVDRHVSDRAPAMK